MENQIQKVVRKRLEEEAAGRRRTRITKNLLSDCTNTFDSLNPSQSLSTSTRNSSSIIKPSKFLTSNTDITNIGTKPRDIQADKTTGSSGGTDDGENDHSPSSSSAILVPSVSTPSQATIPSSLEGAIAEFYEPSSVYSRRKSKRKADAVPMTCFPAIKTQAARDHMKEGSISTISKSCTIPHKKKQHVNTPKEDVAVGPLTQNFIEQQRAYFAEIDGFELPEEEVASVDELD